MKTIKYLEIAQKLIREIKSGRMPAGTRMYSRSELMERFQIGSVTAVAVQNELYNHGYINKIRGSGSYVVYNAQRYANMLEEGVISPVRHFVEYRQQLPPGIHSPYRRELTQALDKQLKRHMIPLEIRTFEYQQITPESMTLPRVEPDTAYLVTGGTAFSNLQNMLFMTDPLIHNVSMDQIFNGANAVVADMYHAMDRLINYMLAKGCQRFLFVPDSLSGNFFYKQESAFCAEKICAQKQLELQILDNDRTSGILQALRSGPASDKKTALLFTGDLGAVRFFKNTAGSKVPDFLLGAMGNYEIKRCKNIPMVTVTHDLDKASEAVCQLLKSPPSVTKKVIRIRGIFETFYS